jgi:hypothetical protein
MGKAFVSVFGSVAHDRLHESLIEESVVVNGTMGEDRNREHRTPNL